MVRRKPHIKVNLATLPLKDGGRRGAFFSGYRGTFFYDGKSCCGSVLLDFNTPVFPDEFTEAYYQFARREHLDAMFVGKPFLLREGHRIVAYGAETELCDEKIDEIDAIF